MTIKTIRTCSLCLSKKTYRKRKGNYPFWYKNPKDRRKWICHKCYCKQVTSPKWENLNRKTMIYFKQKQIRLGYSPHKHICELCGKKRATNLHHLQYDEKEPLAYTVELCLSCHAKEHDFQSKGREKNVKKQSESLL